MEFEDVLIEVGDYGKYQRNLIMIFLVPAASLLPWFSMNIMFMVSKPDHWCNVPELSPFNFTMEQKKSLVAPPGDDEHCLRYDLNLTEILDLANYSVPNGTTTRPCDQGWEYDHTHWDATVSTKWDLVCGDAHYNSFILTMYNVGSIIGTPIYGSLSDKIGRKITFFIVLIITAITAIASVLMHNFTAFVVIKTINGSLMPSIFQLPFIIILEIVAPEMRTRMNGIVNIGWTVGLCFLPLLAYLSRSWVLLGLLTSSVTLVFFFYYTFLPESPRWLVSQERYDEAATILHKIGKKNENVVEKNELVQKLQKLGEKMKNEKNTDGNSPFDLLKFPQLRKKFIIITVCWMSNIMSYYGLQLNASNLAGNEFINFFLLGIAEIPGYLTSWFFMERFGRRWCSAGGFILTGLVCYVSAIEFPYSGIICSMLAKFFAALTFMATYQQSSELYPTVVRSQGMGMSSTLAMLITLIVPYIVLLGDYGKAIPFVIFGTSGILAGILATFLPETLNENLPQTISDCEEFGLRQRFFSLNRRRTSLGRERAASFGIKLKPDGTGDGDNVSKIHRSSQILQKVEFVPGSENTCISVDSVNMLNAEAHNVRKRNSKDGYTKESYAIDTVSNGPSRNSVSEEKQRKDYATQSGEELKQNIDDYRNDKLEGALSAGSLEIDKEGFQNNAPVHSGQDSNEKFSYVNMVFDNKDVVGTKNDDVVIRDVKSGSVYSEYENSGKVDV